MASVAEELRSAREARGLTVQQVVEITKLRSDHVRALEEGDYDSFVAPVYIRGFVRTYASLLRLDVPTVMQALDDELNQTGKFAEPPHLPGGRGGLLDLLMLQISKVDWRKGGLVIAAGVLLAFTVLFLSANRERTRDPLAGVKPAVYQPTQSLSSDTLPVPGTAQPRR